MQCADKRSDNLQPYCARNLEKIKRTQDFKFVVKYINFDEISQFWPNLKSNRREERDSWDRGRLDCSQPLFYFVPQEPQVILTVKLARQRETWARQECERHVSKVLRHGRHRKDGRERRDKRHLKREREGQEGQKIHESYLSNRK